MSMKTVNVLPGTRIDEAALMLCANAPASCEFNGIKLRAKHATTRAADIVARYRSVFNLNRIRYEASPEFKAYQAARDRARASAQAVVDAAISVLPDVNLGSSADVLAWLETIEEPAGRVGVVYDHDAVVEHFRERGWESGVNCGPDFDGDNPRNFAGWIVGQWLASPSFPQKMFIEQWRAKFGR